MSGWMLWSWGWGPLRASKGWPGRGVWACRGEHQLRDAVLQGLCLLHILLLLLCLWPLFLKLLFPFVHPYPDGDSDQETQEYSEKQPTRGDLCREVDIKQSNANIWSGLTVPVLTAEVGVAPSDGVRPWWTHQIYRVPLLVLATLAAPHSPDNSRLLLWPEGASGKPTVTGRKRLWGRRPYPGHKSQVFRRRPKLSAATFRLASGVTPTVLSQAELLTIRQADSLHFIRTLIRTWVSNVCQTDSLKTVHLIQEFHFLRTKNTFSTWSKNQNSQK